MSAEQRTALPQVPVVLEGGLTIYNAGLLKGQLLQALADAQGLDLDLSRVDELDSAGLQVLALIKREAQVAGKQLRILAHSQAVQEAMNLFGMAGWFGDPLLETARAERGG
ncbi:MAG: anti-sigma B factor antagonist [Candidatus Dactylopiibacterium carminicum]|uniref:Anti-sigma B factor antagonist n=1 Tax=Candidatus Dactylopiibacterium carminicum TaxID=857335 RepID=A0A272EN44_9RHOO|nr:STAS domain-containing protein [Candidatus Dactylopiibacterium carminicum]KAF7597949.1 anti-sigma factor antagonist [Candidatus Dactylopiibacterium carminicum]PAS91523.1 MAG: anti-sigma B factor antagonist [Candidatus Dactylopiibacterium carminicum]PAS96100.1 MAG: hypothetical protein BSR46_15910 [Candidatus Dactylopiibacterium carminicum]